MHTKKIELLLIWSATIRVAPTNPPASGELRLIEVKGLGASIGTILLTPNERRVAEDRRDCFWLYVVTDCDTAPRFTGADPRPGTS